jgi:hypothetical protein
MRPIILPGHLTQKGVSIQPMSLPRSLSCLNVIYRKEGIKPPGKDMDNWISNQYRRQVLNPNFNCYILFRTRGPFFVLELTDHYENGFYTMKLVLGLDGDPGVESITAQNLTVILDECLNSFFALTPSVKSVKFKLSDEKFEELLRDILLGAQFQFVGVGLYRRSR